MCGLKNRGKGIAIGSLKIEKTLKRIDKLIADAKMQPFEGLGKPNPLKESLSDFWSRRIEETNRLVDAVDEEFITIISCQYHYQ